MLSGFFGNQILLDNLLDVGRKCPEFYRGSKLHCKESVCLTDPIKKGTFQPRVARSKAAPSSASSQKRPAPPSRPSSRFRAAVSLKFANVVFFRNFFFLSVRFDKTAQKSTKMFNLEKTPTSNNQYARSKIPLKSDIILLKSRRKIINFSAHSTFSKIKSKNVAEMQSSSDPSPTRPHPTPRRASSPRRAPGPPAPRGPLRSAATYAHGRQIAT